MERRLFDLTPRQILLLTTTGALAGAVVSICVDIIDKPNPIPFTSRILSQVSELSGLELNADLNSELIMLQLINKTRSEYDLPPLVLDPTIRSVAIAHSQDMLVREFFDHANPDREMPWDRLKKGGIDFGRAGENLAKASTVYIAHKALMESESHRRNILDPRFTRIGIGVIANGSPARYFITQNFAD